MNNITTDLLMLGCTVERCEHNHSIAIAGIRTSRATEAKLTEYFNDFTKGTVVKEVKRLYKYQIQFAKITFNDHSGIRVSLLVYLYLFFAFTVIPPIMAANHAILGANVRIKECSVFDALGISSDFDEMSKEGFSVFSSMVNSIT